MFSAKKLKLAALGVAAIMSFGILAGCGSDSAMPVTRVAIT